MEQRRMLGATVQQLLSPPQSKFRKNSLAMLSSSEGMPTSAGQSVRQRCVF